VVEVVGAGSVVLPGAGTAVDVVALEEVVADCLFDEHPATVATETRTTEITTRRTDSPAPGRLKR